MSKKRNKKKKLQQQKPLKDQNCYKLVRNQFKEILCRATKLVGFEAYFPLLKDSEFELMRCSMFRPERPICFPGHEIPSKKLQLINNQMQSLARRRIFKIDDIAMSIQECNSLFSLSNFLENRTDGVERLSEFRTKFCERFEREELYQLVYEWYGRFMLQILWYLSSPKVKYYAYESSIEKVLVRPYYMAYKSSILVQNAQSTMLMIHGVARPVFRLGKTEPKVNFKWLTIAASLLGSHYKGHKKELSLYIQSHALNRFAERLDTIDEASLNFCLILRMGKIESFEFYKGYILLPFTTISDVKVGYFVANVIGDKVVFRTFLFVTHSCTPEGDRLNEITGLQKSDIKYWQFDRLSTFASINIDTNPALVNLLKELNLDKLLTLKKLVDEPENMEDTLAVELMAYIERGKKETEEESLMESELCVI